MKVGVKGGLRHREPECEEFAADPLGPPERILARDRLNQVDQVLRETRPTSAGATPEVPEALEPCTMPAEERLWLENEEGLRPGWEAAGEEQEGEAVAAGQARLVDLALKDDELLPEESVLEQEFGLGG